MIVIKQVFRTVVHTREGNTVRVCTGDTVTSMSSDDVAFSEDVPEDVLAVTQRKDVSRRAKASIITQCVLTLFALTGLSYSFYRVFCDCLLAGRFVWSVHSVPAALLSAYFVLCVRELCNPVVHDVAGHWVNLRTGASNLCGGIVVKRKARWP